MREAAGTIEALVVHELKRIEQPELVALAQSLRVPPRLEHRPWDYGHDGQTYPCWVTFAQQSSNTAVVFCMEGFGPAYPWGLLFLTEPRSMGMDSQWFASLEDALRSCPAWDGEDPPGYEVQ
jgi:hypothetical protein